MLSLYIILVKIASDDDDNLRYLKLLIFHCFYMDNGAVTANCSNTLKSHFDKLNSIFNPFGFELKQFHTYNKNLKEIISESKPIETNESSDNVTKLLGTMWDTTTNEIFSKHFNLENSANTKCLILQTVASQYDIYNFTGLLINRARLYLHEIQCDKSQSWDDILSEERLKETHNIFKQANAAPPIKIRRCVGKREDKYSLICFSDANKSLFGVVIYL